MDMENKIFLKNVIWLNIIVDFMNILFNRFILPELRRNCTSK